MNKILIRHRDGTITYQLGDTRYRRASFLSGAQLRFVPPYYRRQIEVHLGLPVTPPTEAHPYVTLGDHLCVASPQRVAHRGGVEALGKWYPDTLPGWFRVGVKLEYGVWAYAYFPSRREAEAEAAYGPSATYHISDPDMALPAFLREVGVLEEAYA